MTRKKISCLRKSREGAKQLEHREVPCSNTTEVGREEKGSWKVWSGQWTIILRQETTEIVVGWTELYCQPYEARNLVMECSRIKRLWSNVKGQKLLEEV